MHNSMLFLLAEQLLVLYLNMSFLLLFLLDVLLKAQPTTAFIDLNRVDFALGCFSVSKLNLLSGSISSTKLTHLQLRERQVPRLNRVLDYVSTDMAVLVIKSFDQCHYDELSGKLGKVIAISRRSSDACSAS